MHARGHIDDQQFMAAVKFERLLACEAGLRAYDPGRVVVDGGKRFDPIGPHQLDASRELAAARTLLGRSCYAFVSNVCGAGVSLAEAGFGSDHIGKLVAGRMLKICLTDLAEAWGRRR